jgi:uncharacterized protein with GYD domain
MFREEKGRLAFRASQQKTKRKVMTSHRGIRCFEIDTLESRLLLSSAPIGIQFVQEGPTLASSQVAGVVPQDNFNPVDVNNSSGTSGTTGDLIDANGNTTGITLTHVSNDGFNTDTDTTTPNGILLHGEDKSGPAGTSSGPGETATYTFNNLTSGTYDLIAYIETDPPSSGVEANITIGSTTYYVVDESVQSGTPAFALANNTNADSRVTGNYVEFFDVAPVAGQIILTNTSEGDPVSNSAAINGFQLIPQSAPAPDLTAQFTGTIPSQVTTGTTISPTLQITDSAGAGPVTNGNELTDYYLSTTPDLTGTTTLIGSSTETLNLAPGNSYTENPTLTVPSNQTPGSYYVVALVNANDGIVESNTTNDIAATGPITVQASQPSLFVNVSNAQTGAATGTVIQQPDPTSAILDVTNQLDLWMGVKAVGSVGQTLTADPNSIAGILAKAGIVNPNGDVRYDATYSAPGQQVSVTLTFNQTAIAFNVSDFLLTLVNAPIDLGTISQKVEQLSVLPAIQTAIKDITAATTAHQNIQRRVTNAIVDMTRNLATHPGEIVQLSEILGLDLSPRDILIDLLQIGTVIKLGEELGAAVALFSQSQSPPIVVEFTAVAVETDSVTSITPISSASSNDDSAFLDAQT